MAASAQLLHYIWFSPQLKHYFIIKHSEIFIWTAEVHSHTGLCVWQSATIISNVLALRTQLHCITAAPPEPSSRRHQPQTASDSSSRTAGEELEGRTFRPAAASPPPPAGNLHEGHWLSTGSPSVGSQWKGRARGKPGGPLHKYVSRSTRRSSSLPPNEACSSNRGLLRVWGVKRDIASSRMCHRVSLSPSKSGEKSFNASELQSFRA